MVWKDNLSKQGLKLAEPGATAKTLATTVTVKQIADTITTSRRQCGVCAISSRWSSVISHRLT